MPPKWKGPVLPPKPPRSYNGQWPPPRPKGWNGEWPPPNWPKAPPGWEDNWPPKYGKGEDRTDSEEEKKQAQAAQAAKKNTLDDDLGLDEGSDDEKVNTEELHKLQEQQFLAAMGEEDRKKKEEKAKKKKEDKAKADEATKIREQRKKEEEERLADADKKNILVILADGVDEMVAVSVINILKLGGVNVISVSVSNVPTKPDLQVKGANGMALHGDMTFETNGNASFGLFDALVLPGGIHLEKLANNAKLVSLIKAFVFRNRYVCAVGDAVFHLLCRNEMLQDKKVTGSLSTAEMLEAQGAKYVAEEGVVSHLNFLTCKSAGHIFDFTLQIIQSVLDEQAAAITAEKLDYRPFLTREDRNFLRPHKHKQKAAEHLSPDKVGDKPAVEGTESNASPTPAQAAQPEEVPVLSPPAAAATTTEGETTAEAPAAEPAAEHQPATGENLPAQTTGASAIPQEKTE